MVELVDAAAERWRAPDRGIWELRGRPRQLVHSKVMCWVALDRGLRLAEEVGFPAPVARWTATRAAIRAAIERQGYDPRGGVHPGARTAEQDALSRPVRTRLSRWWCVGCSSGRRMGGWPTSCPACVWRLSVIQHEWSGDVHSF
jgi:Glycosyl hydrolases family 15